MAARLMKRRTRKAPLEPRGTPKITVFDYTATSFTEKTITRVEEFFQFKKTPTVTWINISRSDHHEIVEKIGSYFDIHPLVAEDIVQFGQRPKMEDFDNYIYIVMDMLSRDDKGELKSEQVSIILSKNFVITFVEGETDVFEPVRERIRKGKGKLRTLGSDYLVYRLIDAVVEGYFTVLESVGERVEVIEGRCKPQK